MCRQARDSVCISSVTMQVRSSLIFRGPVFVNSPTYLICSLQINACSAFSVIHGHLCSHPMGTLPAQFKRTTLCLLLPSHAVNKGPFYGLLHTIVFTCTCSLLVILLFEMAPGIELKLSSVPECRKAGMGLTRNIRVR